MVEAKKKKKSDIRNKRKWSSDFLTVISHTRNKYIQDIQGEKIWAKDFISSKTDLQIKQTYMLSTCKKNSGTNIPTVIPKEFIK